MNNQKIVRTVCIFTQSPNDEATARLDKLENKLVNAGFMVQTKRVSSTLGSLDSLLDLSTKGVGYVSVGDISLTEAKDLLPTFYSNNALTFNLELANEEIGLEHVSLLQDIIENNASRTFSFTYTFNNAASSPYFPSARYEKDGFAVGIQPTDLSAGCSSID